MRISLFCISILFGLNTYSQCNNTFKLLLKGSGNDVGYDLLEIPGGDMIIVGETNSFGTGGNDIFLTRMTKNGGVVWNKSFGGTGDEQIRKIKLALDGDLIITGKSTSLGNTNGDAIAMKIDVNGNIKWSIKLAESTGYSLGLDILSTTDNGFVISGTKYASNASSDWLLVKVDAAGNLQWSKRFDFSVNEDAFSLIQKNDTVIVSGNSQTTTNYSGLIVKVGLLNGNVYNSQAYNLDNRGVFGSKIQFSSNEYRISLHIIDGNSYSLMQEGFVIMSPLFEKIKTFKINAPIYENWYYTGFCETKDGGYIVTSCSPGSNEGYLYKFDKQNNLVFTNRFFSGNAFKVSGTFEASDLSIWIVGTENNELVVMKLNASGQFDHCVNQAVIRTTPSVSFTEPAFAWSSVSAYNFTNLPATFSRKDFDFLVDSLCFGPICRGIDLTGEDSVCNLSDTLVYKVTRIGNCSNTLNWSLPSGVYSQNVNDTTVKINFPVARLYKIKATNNGACADQSDSITVMVKPAPSVINLGNDSLICNSTQKIVLDPGAGYNKYRWQDNSNSQQFTVTQSGFYYVTATNYCNQEKSDSVKLTIRNDAGFSVSPGDTSYCIQSPIQFTAKGGDVYSWSPVAFLNDPTTNNPIGNPDSSITYTVTITDTLCKITKDLDVKIVIVPLLQITLSKSNDVDCTTGAARLTATGGTTYQWSPTSTLSNPNIGSPTARPLETTTYNVIASNSLGCQTKDSITVHFSKTGIAELFVPNAFSPNNDRKNDVFRVLLKGAFKLKQFAVFNRYGEMIFSTSDSSKDWNGYYKNTLQLPGVYVWMVKAWSPCTGDFFKKGTILLVK